MVKVLIILPSNLSTVSFRKRSSRQGPDLPPIEIASTSPIPNSAGQVIRHYYSNFPSDYEEYLRENFLLILDCSITPGGSQAIIISMSKNVVQSNLATWDCAVWDTGLCGTVFLATAKHILLCTSPVYVGHLAVGQLGSAVVCPTYPGSTV